MPNLPFSIISSIFVPQTQKNNTKTKNRKKRSLLLYTLFLLYKVKKKLIKRRKYYSSFGNTAFYNTVLPNILTENKFVLQ